jgi:hypothetical protein
MSVKRLLPRPQGRKTLLNFLTPVTTVQALYFKKGFGLPEWSHLSGNRIMSVHGLNYQHISQFYKTKITAMKCFTVLAPEAVFLVVCDPSMNELGMT